MRILAIESSCDETAAAVVENGRTVLSSLVNSQVAEHAQYGGVVPEIASRRHVENIGGLVRGALEKANMTLAEVDAVAVTCCPGLIGALLVGVNFAKGLAFSAGKPLIGVHHIRGHVAANYIAYPELKPPFFALIVSGGHTVIARVKDYTKFEIVGTTRDDAAGEAFDKAARVLGFPYPGGIYIDRAAKTGNPHAYKLPMPMIDGHPYDFSFSGLKTAVINLAHNAEQKGESLNPDDLAASFQHTAVTMLCDRFFAAAEQYGEKKLVLAGGVAANSGLRSELQKHASAGGYELFIPPLSLCGDNAAMIGAQAYYEFLAGNIADNTLNGTAYMSIDYESGSKQWKTSL
ncbi:MAG TPA: tRNA (adenosine(37)-N6)-threonylcarbamoyltransferase complex transferase subunit TsaD [Oscillospiraceae bacterium]|nr:tRNA (adenosine(37)-N6)-threonylcarbamoyltransferase complex transferase subunit TsaD [Oscillospiraceae bacterium]HPF55402.1 tRNA (adenosine(37)-N6)-threonylcarbamoyltransferase complex transferase subunit TsaD [Clostridiales bacterium]HPK35614.1 tRNA (adenosine(37)-N6)-threonylcarbamoyltransferase complex transferase subunit TsaD [Oscillospiraceae bacterium]HPR74678.1 tRNA (adenosine(37)-N6)-threonylcarbamoyltransferase complex transferase subunit TsaD [Oscillospiraceae bacterium]